MKKGAKKKLDEGLTPATKNDVKEIVTDIVTNVVTAAFDDFAIKVQNGFKEVHNRIDGVEAKMVTKDEFLPFKKETEQSLYGLKTDMVEVKGRLANVEGRLDTVEDKMDDMIDVVKNHETRITRFERTAA